MVLRSDNAVQAAGNVMLDFGSEPMVRARVSVSARCKIYGQLGLTLGLGKCPVRCEPLALGLCFFFSNVPASSPASASRGGRNTIRSHIELCCSHAS